MIYGRKQTMAESGEVFDYVACFYPEGNVSPEYTFLFNHDDIEEVVFTGYFDEDETRYVEAISSY